MFQEIKYSLHWSHGYSRGIVNDKHNPVLTASFLIGRERGRHSTGPLVLTANINNFIIKLMAALLFIFIKSTAL